MRSHTFLLCIMFLLWGTPSYSTTPQVIPLKLHRALFVDGPERNQPSGLTIWNGTLFAVSDKHDATVFKISWTNDAARMEPYLSFDVPKAADSSVTPGCDFEGITCDPQGNFYLVSERLCRILRVSTDGKETAWITPDLRPRCEEQGLFKVENACLEGISMIAPGLFVLCAERQPRGFVEVDTTQTPLKVSAYQSEETTFDIPTGRSPDFSGLFWEDNRLYVVERSVDLICPLTLQHGRYEEGPGWSYKHVVTQPEYAYADMKHGMGEGVCLDSQYVYVVFDNNEDSRVSEPHDTRPLLLILQRPDI